MENNYILYMHYEYMHDYRSYACEIPIEIVVMTSLKLPTYRKNIDNTYILYLLYEYMHDYGGLCR